MYVSLPPGCYASAVMCEEHSIVPFFLISNLLCLVAYFFRCYCERYLVRFLFQVFVSLFVCLFLSAGSEIRICLLFLLSMYMMDVISQYLFSGRFRF